MNSVNPIPGSSDPRLWVAAIGVMFAVILAAWVAMDASARVGGRYERRLAHRIERRLAELLVFVDVRRLLTLNLLVVIGLPLFAWLITGAWPLAAVAAVLALAAPNWLLLRLARRRRQRFTAQLPDLLLLVAGSLRAGAGLTLALRQVSLEIASPAGQEIDLVLREQRLGSSLDQALTGLERRMGGDELRLFTAAIRIASDTGGNLAETLERLADSIRQRLAIEAKIEALTSQGRLQGWIMAALPVAVALALFVLEPEAMEPLVATWQGWLVLAGVAVLELAGLLMIRRIMSIDV
ncbi:MAG: type II secretion system F family protein [Burkholderiaceae bacterium]